MRPAPAIVAGGSGWGTMSRTFLVLFALLWATSVRADDTVRYGPPPAWVKAIPVPQTAGPSGVSAQSLLRDGQTLFGDGEDQFFSHTAVRVLSPQGLSAVGSISLVWDPATEAVSVHKVLIHRDGQVIDVLARGKFLVLRRETNLEIAMLDGSLTATLQPDDLRVGDILEVATTTTRRDPAYQGHSEALASAASSLVVPHIYLRSVWASSKPLRWRATAGLSQPALVRSGDRTELVYDLTDSKSPPTPTGAPARFSRVSQLEMSDYADWAELSSLLAPAYVKAATLAPNSPLNAEVTRIRAAHAAPKARAEAALRLVQDQVRYLFLGMDRGGLIPADADQTWARRFGDCKGKTALLLALLRELGIDAQPALVDSDGGDGMEERLPQIGLFDHVIVKARIDGKVYWLDGTRIGDWRIDDVRIPGFGWALPVASPGASLERLLEPPLDAPSTEMALTIDLSAGADLAAPARLEIVTRGDDATRLRGTLSRIDRAEYERQLRENASELYPWITPKEAGFKLDEDKGELLTWVEGTARIEWTQSETSRQFGLAESALGWDAAYTREPGENQNVPYAVAHPFYTRRLLTIRLPQNDTGFVLVGGEDVEQTTGGFEFVRRSSNAAGLVTVETSTRSVASEFPAREAASAGQAIRALNRSYIALATTNPVARPETSQAAGLSRRGVVALTNDDYDAAIDAFGKAAELEPKSARHRYNRGLAYLRKKQADTALVEFNAALTLQADYPLALLARGEAYLVKGDDIRAEADFDRAIRLAPRNAALRPQRAEAYIRAGRYEGAVRAFARLIAEGPVTSELLAGHCRAAARSGQALADGLANCDKALASAGDADVEVSRALMLLRMGRLDEAANTLDTIVQKRQDDGAAWFARGLVKVRKGQSAQARSDFETGRLLDHEVDETFAGFGLKP